METDLHRVVLASPRLSTNSKRAYLRAVSSFVSFAGLKPKLWTPRLAQEWYQAELARTSAQSAGQAAYALRYASRRLAAEANDPGIDFARYIELQPVLEKAERRALTVDETKALLKVRPEDNPVALRDRALTTLLIGTGMRRGGALSCEKLTEGTVTIMLKGGRKFVVPLAEPIMRDLLPWVEWLKAHKAFKEKPLFPILTGIGSQTMVGDTITPDSLYWIIQQRGALAGLDKLHPHILRHTFITLARQNGATVEEIAAVTGHYLPGHTSEIETTYVDRLALGAAATLKLPIWR